MEALYKFSTIEEIKVVVSELKSLIQEHEVVAFYGEMGVGKTTLIKEICYQFGVVDVVNSPTFSIVNEYLTNNNKTIYHFDFYRIDDLTEALDMGCDDYFYSGNLCLIEWPEKVDSLLPPNTLKLEILLRDNNQRELFIK